MPDGLSGIFLPEGLDSLMVKDVEVICPSGNQVPGVDSRSVSSLSEDLANHRGLQAEVGRCARRKERICRTASGIRSLGSFHGNMLTSAFGANIAVSMATA